MTIRIPDSGPGPDRGERMDGDSLAANPLQMQPDATWRKPKRSQGGPGRPFLKGMSGNPGGKRPGTRNRATIIAEAMLDCEARPAVARRDRGRKGWRRRHEPVLP